MKSSGTTSKSRSSLSYKALIFVATLAVIVYFLPRDGKFNYQFDLGKPWKYGQLMATFDFPIYKDDAVIAHEMDSLRHAFQPYFTVDRSKETAVMAKLRTAYNDRLKSILPSAEYYKYIERTLHEIYSTGILSAEDAQRLAAEDSVTAIRVVSDKQALSQTLAQTYTGRRAYEKLLSDSAHYSAYILRRCSLSDFIVSNLVYDEERTATARQEMQDNYSWAKGGILSGQKIIDRGEIVSAEKYSILESLRKESIKRSESASQKRLILGGQTLFVAIMILLFFLYLDLYRRDYFDHHSSLTLMLALMVIYCVTTALMVSNNILNVSIVPFAMGAIIIRVFLDSRTAFMVHLVTILICSITLRLPYEFILVQLTGGVAAIFSLKELSQRSQIFRTALLTTLTYAAVFFAYELVVENDVNMISLRPYYYFIINGILLLFTYPLLFLLEKTFGFTSNVTLVELSNINNDLLKQMSETVPGTFQHSMQVSNLAAEAADRIGAKSQLVRTGALYHDIGKMENPAFFTENQSGGLNPHKSLSYEQSAQVVISHVTDGLRLAEKHNLPTVIKDFISTHHGRGKTKFFYISWKNEHPDQEPDEAMFTYPGPNPFTKETAVLMMADSVEAASRSLSEYTEESIGALVDKIIDSQVAEGYFRECPITFKDIATVKAVFKEKLKIIYHTRVKYPELNASPKG
jgi:hypothetical protein